MTPDAQEALLGRFPGARKLWSLTASNRDGYVNAFTVTAYNVNGAVVLVQEFAEHGWDAYVQASLSGEIVDTLEAIDTATKRKGDYSNPGAPGRTFPDAHA